MGSPKVPLKDILSQGKAKTRGQCKTRHSPWNKANKVIKGIEQKETTTGN